MSEKNAFYPCLLGFSVEPGTHLATAVKSHEDLGHLFKEPKLLTKEDGEKVRLWNQSAKPLDAGEQVIKRARVAADGGTETYRAFFLELTAAQKKLVQPFHEENKFVAEQADVEAKAAQGSDNDPLP